LQKEEEKLRMAMRVQSKPKKQSGGGRGSNRAAANYGNDPYHDEGSDDENAISLAAIKNKYKKAAASGGISKRK
jgi:RNA polymerase-associated protein LEO1